MDTLEELHLPNCSKLSDISSLGRLKKLKVLNLRGCSSITSQALKILRQCPILKVLSISECYQLESLDFLIGMDLEYFSLRGLQKLNDLSPIGSNINLMELRLMNALISIKKIHKKNFMICFS